MNNSILERMIYDKEQQNLFKMAQTNGTSFANNNINVKAIKEDFKKNHLDVHFDIYYSQSQDDKQIVNTDGTIINYNNASGCIYAMLTDKKEKNLYLRIIEFYTFFLRQFDYIQDENKEMDKYRTYPSLFTYTITTKLKTPFASAGEGIESIDYFESGAQDTLNSFKSLKEKTLNGNSYIIIKESTYPEAFKKALSIWKRL